MQEKHQHGIYKGTTTLTTITTASPTPEPPQTTTTTTLKKGINNNNSALSLRETYLPKSNMSISYLQLPTIFMIRKGHRLPFDEETIDSPHEKFDAMVLVLIIIIAIIIISFSSLLFVIYYSPHSYTFINGENLYRYFP